MYALCVNIKKIYSTTRKTHLKLHLEPFLRRPRVRRRGGSRSSTKSTHSTSSHATHSPRPAEHVHHLRQYGGIIGVERWRCGAWRRPSCRRTRGATRRTGCGRSWWRREPRVEERRGWRGDGRRRGCCRALSLWLRGGWKTGGRERTGGSASSTSHHVGHLEHHPERLWVGPSR